MKSLSRSIAVALALSVVLTAAWAVQSQDMPFGSDDDVAFAKKLWTAMDGYDNWLIQSDFFPGQSPHGAFLRTSFSLVTIDGKPYHVVVKDNYGGEGATLKTVEKSPDTYLKAVTVMVQREAGYDSDNDNWSWVKFTPDGSIEMNPKGIAMAGRVAKGTERGCIHCHAKAKGDDLFFSNDKYDK